MATSEQPVPAAAQLAHSPELLGSSPAAARLRELIARAAASPGCVLIVAPHGCDAPLLGRDLHARSSRADGPYVVVDCATSGIAALDVELFGPVPLLAPSDLESVSPSSVIAAARGGTVFLEAVTELPAGTQSRVARIARDGEVRIDGQAVPTALRLVASAPPTIDADVRAHRVRADLYRRLARTRIDVPALSDRTEDVPELAARILQDLCSAGAQPRRTFTDAALKLLAALTWPGNVAELRAMIARVAAATKDAAIRIEDVVPALQIDRVAAPPVAARNLREARQRFEREYICAVLQHHQWRMSDAARALGIQRPNLYRKARQLGIPLAKAAD